LSDAQMALIPNVCGNGMVEGDEACDDGNAAYGDGCTPTCAVGNAVMRSEVAADVSVQLPFSADGQWPGRATTTSLRGAAGSGLTDSGPATVAVMAAGAAAGTAWVRRRMKRKR
jgi:cysteine-rich repeat protein